MCFFCFVFRPDIINIYTITESVPAQLNYLTNADLWKFLTSSMNKKNTHSQLSTYFSKDYIITTTGNGRIYVSASLGDMLLILFLGEICVISGPVKTRKSPIVIEPNIKECSQCITLKKRK